MKLPDVFLLYPALALFIIGLHQIVTRGFAQSYWIVMLALLLFFTYQWRKTKNEAAAKTPASKSIPPLKRQETQKETAKNRRPGGKKHP